MSYEYCDKSDGFSINDIQDIEYNPWIEVKTVNEKGRCVHAKKFIPRGTMVFRDIPYSAVVDNQFKRNICCTCFKIFLESNRHNVQTCPGCLQVHYCSNYCKQYSKIETKHTELECKWINDFSTSFKHQMPEDDRNIVLLVLKIIARKKYEKEPAIFLNKPKEQQEEQQKETCNIIDLLPPIPNDIVDLIDHLDDYCKNSKINLGSNDSDSSSSDSDSEEKEKEERIIDDNEKEKDEIKKYIKIWKNHFKRLINISKIIQIIIDDSIDSIASSNNENSTTFGFIDIDGDSEMTDLSNDPGKDLNNLVDNLKPSDLNILSLLCKIRSNYFGLWHTGYKQEQKQQLININHDDDDDDDDDDSDDDKSNVKNEYLWCGSAVYLKLSLFNHSCFPNCTTIIEYNSTNSSLENIGYHGNSTRNPLTISIITLRDIKKDDELLITYVPLNQKRNDRIKSLKSNWLFQCDCKRCHFETIDSTKTESIYNESCCSVNKCAGGLVIPIEPNSNQGVCRVCKNIKSPLPTEFSPIG